MVKPLIKINPGEKNRLEDIAHSFSLDADLLQQDLRNILKENYRSFGTNVFNLDFSAKNGYSIYANSNIGRVAGQLIELQIEPKITNISIGKCLGMSQVVKDSPASISSNSKVRGIISKDIEYSSIEYIAFTYVDSLHTVIQNGLARKFEDVIRITNENGGSIMIEEWIARGKTPPPSKSINEPSIDILPNQILSAAIRKCLEVCKSLKLKIALQTCLQHFNGAQTDNVLKSDIDSVLLHRFNIPRKDYDRALSFALSILKGCALADGSSEYLPSFTIDLDILFEEFCTVVLKQLLKPDKFIVESQISLPHNSSPEYAGTICPDIIVKNKETGRVIVLDLKNKYSSRSQEKGFYASNQDLFQMVYYLNTTKAMSGILVYPESSSVCSFPIPGSESTSSYSNKVRSYRDRAHIFERTFFPSNKVPLNIRSYFIDLSGSMANTIKSLASLAYLIDFMTKSDE
jgi:5-methylcytosine-specific restriction endonuclease McrBC regulatory subunit McrC